ncbi:MAG: peptidase T [Clostridia bacterium]|nr:peptidase T [Clostridia bacterium]
MRAYERLLRYVQYDTASNGACDACPSTETQRDFGRVLVDEMKEMGLSNVRQDEHGYVYALLPANAPGQSAIGLIAHMDTVDDAPALPMKAHIVKNYQGVDIQMDEDGKNVLSPAVFPSLNAAIGKDLIVTDGNTLLGADDKAGVAEILTLCEELLAHPEIKHGDVCVGFTPDEEIGRGADLFDIPGFGAEFAYTVDGGALPEIDYENFNAASASIAVNGLSIHPGSAKDKMKNALLIAHEFISMLPSAERPEHTEGREGFYHLTDMSGEIEKAAMHYIIRDHDMKEFTERKAYMQRVADFLNAKYGEGTVELTLKDSYYNMIEKLADHMDVVERANDAFRKLGYEPVSVPVRGGTDGARLSFMGLPCPNLPTGGFNCHGRFEYAVIQDMDEVVKLLKNIVEAR